MAAESGGGVIMSKDPVICAECDYQGKIIDGYITCEKTKKKNVIVLSLNGAR